MRHLRGRIRGCLCSVCGVCHAVCRWLSLLGLIGLLCSLAIPAFGADCVPTLTLPPHATVEGSACRVLASWTGVVQALDNSTPPKAPLASEDVSHWLQMNLRRTGDANAIWFVDAPSMFPVSVNLLAIRKTSAELESAIAPGVPTPPGVIAVTLDPMVSTLVLARVNSTANSDIHLRIADPATYFHDHQILQWTIGGALGLLLTSLIGTVFVLTALNGRAAAGLVPALIGLLLTGVYTARLGWGIPPSQTWCSHAVMLGLALALVGGLHAQLTLLSPVSRHPWVRQVAIGVGLGALCIPIMAATLGWKLALAYVGLCINVSVGHYFFLCARSVRNRQLAPIATVPLLLLGGSALAGAAVALGLVKASDPVMLPIVVAAVSADVLLLQLAIFLKLQRGQIIRASLDAAALNNSHQWNMLLEEKVRDRTRALAQEAERHRNTSNELKLRQRQLMIQREKAETSLKAERNALLEYKGLIQLIAHEIKNPLAIMRSHSQLAFLLASQGKPLDPKTLRAIDDAIVRLDALVGRWTEGESKVEHALALRTFTKERVSVNSLVYAAVARASPPSNIDIRIRPCSRDVHVTADPALIQIVLLQFIDNSIRHSGSSAIVVSADIDDTAQWALFDVRDFGCGISKMLHDTIFEYGASASSVLHEGESRDGVGLWIARRVAQIHDGTVHSVDVTPQPGALFRLMLPLVVATGDEPPAHWDTRPMDPMNHLDT